MYIQKKPAAAILRLVISLVSLGLMRYLLSEFGYTAFRLFPTWVLIISSVYYLISALLTAVSVKKFTGRTFWPMLEGMLFLSCFMMGGIAIASAQYHFYLPELSSWLIWAVCLLLPLLIFADWLLFTKKGYWRVMYPFYWLALPLCYAATMIFTTQILPDNIELRFPLEMFNYLQFGFWEMLGWMLVIALLVLVVGYVMYLIDFTVSGKLAKIIVLPHLQVVEVDEDGNIISEVPAEKPASPSSNSDNHPKASVPKAQPSKNSTSTKASHKPTSPEIIKIEIEKPSVEDLPKSNSKPKTSKPSNSQKTNKAPAKSKSSSASSKPKSSQTNKPNSPKSKPAKVNIRVDDESTSTEK